ncbi:MAG: ABC transporter ATP-binding protein [Clostridiaceae bacterium]|jgi:ABC-2 type transport system ATP-binding protein|nr:ABC transporter ATP-binding protein [Clostridiaceae bacterium]
MISIHEISKSYDQETQAVDNLSLEIYDNEIFGFVGPNGAGKTTSLKMITGLLLPDHGSIKINGIDVVAKPLEAKKNLSFVSDDPNIFLRLKGIEYLRFLADIYEVGEDLRVERIKDLSHRFAMSNVLDQKIQSYSHGMRQKIILIGALIHNPPTWVLDEPMTGLDPSSSYQLKNMMREHADKGNTVLFSTHVLDVAEKVCDRLGVISEGKLLFVGTMAELRKKYQEDSSLESIFLEMVGEEQFSPFALSEEEAGSL